MTIEIACIVEGRGEEEAVPILIRRIAQEADPAVDSRVTVAIREPKSKLQREGELERAVEYAARKTAGRGGVIVVMDADDDCPAQTAPSLLRRAMKARDDLPVAVVLAKREFEAWFLAAARSLRGKRGLPVTLEPPQGPEDVRGAKEWLMAQMPAGRKYRETLDQPALAAVFDIQSARRAPSFDKLYREVARLVGILKSRSVAGRDQVPPRSD